MVMARMTAPPMRIQTFLFGILSVVDRLVIGILRMSRVVDVGVGVGVGVSLGFDAVIKL